MSAQILVLLMSVVGLAYDWVCWRLSDRQQREPTPDIVADVYDADRYAEYLQICAEECRAYLVYKAFDFAILACFLYSPFFAWAERAVAGNVYLVVLITSLIMCVIANVEVFVYDHYDTFHIEGAHGLNHMDGREFARDFLLDELPSDLLILLVFEAVAFVGEHMAAWTGGYTLDASGASALAALLVLGGAVLAFAATLVRYRVLCRQYTLTPLEGPLRDKIMGFAKGSRKRLAKIYVYDESKKSPELNAMLVSLPWRKELWIADNALDSWDERTVLAVVSHEIGHLKHRFDLVDAAGYLQTAATVAVIAALIAHPSVVFEIEAWVRASYGLGGCNYVLLTSTVLAALRPVTKLLRALGNAAKRHREYEADREAVRNGYAAELSEFLKEAARKELVNVDPHPFVEAMEDDHPGLCRRLTAISEAEDRKISGE